jgi:hypothetical protein
LKFKEGRATRDKNDPISDLYDIYSKYLHKIPSKQMTRKIKKKKKSNPAVFNKKFW